MTDGRADDSVASIPLKIVGFLVALAVCFVVWGQMPKMIGTPKPDTGAKVPEIKVPEIDETTRQKALAKAQQDHQTLVKQLEEDRIVREAKVAEVRQWIAGLRHEDATSRETAIRELKDYLG